MSRSTASIRGRLAARRRSRRFLTVESGPASGLVISLERASAEYGAGTNELPVQEAMQRRVDPGGVVFDVGANVGFFSLLAARLVGPAGRVVAFEPVAENAERVRINAARNGFDQVEVVEAAVGATSGSATLHVTRHPGGATTAAEATDDVITGTIEVPMVTLDELVASGAAPAPTFVKIDVEGTEPAALSGMSEILAGPGPVVLVELDAPDVDGVDQKVAAVEAMLRGYGYRVDILGRSYVDGAWCVRHLLAVPGGLSSW